MILRSFAIALFVGGCALAGAAQDIARQDAPAVSVDSAQAADSSSNHPADASMMPSVDAFVPSPDASINGTCAHAICSSGAALKSSCSSCTQEICAQDDYCCQTKWDSECIGEVESICGDTCS